jgi:Na+/H+ antiporter NhaC
MEKENSTNRLSFYGGYFGAWLPMILFIVMLVSIIASTGKAGFNYLIFGLFASICLGFLLSKDRNDYASVLADGLTDRTLAVVIQAFLFAGVLSQLLRQSGLMQGMIWLVSVLNINSGFLPLIVFLISAIIATSTGTSSGTVTTVTPILFPMAVNLGCNPGLVMGAIISGALFGDNLAPISDTTISSALTQGVEVSEVVRTRLPYSLIGGFISAVLFIVLGFQSSEGTLSSVTLDSSYASSLVMLIIPVLMIFMMIKGSDLVSTLLVCNFVGIILNLFIGRISPLQMLLAEGPIVSGMTGMLSVTLLVLLVFQIVAVLRESGALDYVIQKVMERCKNATQAELVAYFSTMLTTAAVAGSTPAIIIDGPAVKKIINAYNIEPSRGSNILDGIACATCGIVPYCTPYLIGVSLAIQSGVVTEAFGYINILPYVFHPYALLLLFLLSILTGVGRKYKS